MAKKLELDSNLFIRIKKEERQKIGVVAKKNGYPSTSLYIRNIIEKEINNFEKKYGKIEMEEQA